ncbi:hypothetical protein HB662_04420 [Roseomonas frigidaquae]|uniref:Uncharacterized protein n=1 Tax=Falsiroseomonas frigidaquae TaxID=487318 RepID=A0ABX1ETX7_9PROT|nr:hypothetical protein [Falsiroseomonas frigidaquae]NKE44008.1 hypothetical protein [Falsiroseomonas frigidaquae]
MSDAVMTASSTARPAASLAGSNLDLDLMDIGQLVAVDAAWPLHPGCLRAAAESEIIEWARRQPTEVPLNVTVRLPPDAMGSADKARLGDALATHFGLLAEAQERSAKEHLSDARRSLAIGLAILAACLTTAWVLVADFPERPLTRIARESIGILGWVAMWKPVEMLLHDRRPILRRLRLLRRLAQASVRVVPAGPR